MRWEVAIPTSIQVEPPFRLQLILDHDDPAAIADVEAAALEAGVTMERIVEPASAAHACRACGVLGGKHVSGCENAPPEIDGAEVIEWPV